MWPAARRLVEYFECVADEEGLTRPGVRVLELGAGTGWLAMALARNLPNARSIVPTEMASGGALAWLQRNMCANERDRRDGGDGLWKPGVLSAVECDWSTYLGGAATKSGYGDDEMGGGEFGDGDGDGEADCNGDADGECVIRDTDEQSPSTSSSFLNSTPWDFIVGSDLVYDDDGTWMLPKVFRALLDYSSKARRKELMTMNQSDAPAKKTACAFYAHTKYRYELRDIEFFAEMKKCGLVLTEVKEPNAPTPPSSPEALSQLFPEKRIAVFRITRAEDEDEDGL